MLSISIIETLQNVAVRENQKEQITIIRLSDRQAPNYAKKLALIICGFYNKQVIL